MARQPHHPAHRKGHNNRSIGRATAVRQQHQQQQLKQEKRQYFVYKTTAALARQQQPPTRSTGFNNRSIGKATASSYTPNSYGSSSSGKETAAPLHTAWPQQQRHWRGNSAFTANSNATTTAQHRHSIGTATAFDSPTHGNRISCQSQGKDQ